MFVCKICDEEYDEDMRYSRDSRYCKKCGEERTQYLTATDLIRVKKTLQCYLILLNNYTLT